MRDKSWHYPPGCEHRPDAPWNQTPEYRTPDKEEIVDLIDRASSLADDIMWLETQYDNQPSGIADAEKKVREVAAFLMALLDELEEGEE